jgi:hypothetical protein
MNTDLACEDMLKQSEHPPVNLDKGQIIRNKQVPFNTVGSTSISPFSLNLENINSWKKSHTN